MTNNDKLREAKKVLLKNGYSFIKNSNRYSMPEATQESISEAYNYLNEAAAIDFFKEKIKQIKSAFKSAKSSGDKSGVEEARAEAKELQSEIKSSSLGGAVKKALLIAIAAVAMGASGANAASCFSSMEKMPDGTTHMVQYGDCADMEDVENDLMSFTGKSDGGSAKVSGGNAFDKLAGDAKVATYNNDNKTAFFASAEYLAKLFNSHSKVKVIDNDVKPVKQDKQAKYDVYTFSDGAVLYLGSNGENVNILKTAKGTVYKVKAAGQGGIYDMANSIAKK